MAHSAVRLDMVAVDHFNAIDDIERKVNENGSGMLFQRLHVGGARTTRQLVSVFVQAARVLIDARLDSHVFVLEASRVEAAKGDPRGGIHIALLFPVVLALAADSA